MDAEPTSPGEFEFVVGRLPGRLAVWQKGHRRNAATVAAPSAGSSRLQLRPLRWATDLKVQFSSGAGEEGEAVEEDGETARNVTGPPAVALLRVGAKVFRGPDWKWGEQDGGGAGRVVAWSAFQRLAGIVGVRWENTGSSNIYRMGAEGKYDLAVLEDSSASDVDVPAIVPDMSAETCDEFQCKSGGCVTYFDKCDGVFDCDDLSDEDPAMCRANTVALPEGRATTARVQIQSEHGWLEFHMCGKRNCSTLAIYGLTPAKRLRYVAGSDCNKNSRKCDVDNEHAGPGDDFHPGELEFVIARRPGRLDVWRAGHPEDVATVPVSSDSDTLQAQPGRWVSDLRVQYSPAEDALPAADGSADGSAGGRAALVTGPAAVPLLKVGARVMRGRDWMWGDQDGHGLGRVTEMGMLMRLVGVVKVRWDNGHENVYRMSAADDNYDLAVLAGESPSVDAEDIPAFVTDDDDVTDATAVTGVVVGSRVVRGKDWKWEDQDGTPPGQGTVKAVNSPLEGWVQVLWDSGRTSIYRMGFRGKQDLDIVDTASTTTEPASPPPTTTQSSTTSTEWEEVTDATADTGVVVGSRVVRGKDWMWEDQDGTPPGEGTVTRVDGDGWVQVLWDTGNKYSYRMEVGGKQDLALVGSASSSPSSTTPPSTTTQSTSTEWEEVTHATAATDLTNTASSSTESPTSTAPPSTTTQSSTTSTESFKFVPLKPMPDESDSESAEEILTPTTRSPVEGGRVTGAEAAARLQPCSRVVRGQDWKWDEQDGGPGTEGRVVGRVNNSGWVSVRWPNGDNNLYRMGAERKYDLALLEGDESPSAEADPECSPDKAGNKAARRQPQVIGISSF